MIRSLAFAYSTQGHTKKKRLGFGRVMFAWLLVWTTPATGGTLLLTMKQTRAGSSLLPILLCTMVWVSIARGQTSAPVAQRIKLWPDTQPAAGRDTDDNPAVSTLDIYLAPAQSNTGTTIIIMPGGGYAHLSTVREGSDVAKLLNEHGINAFVLRYRLSPRFHFPTPMLDAQRAMRLVRSGAADYKINPNRIGILGFSAGGHLASTLATQFDAGDPSAANPIDRASCRPDFAALLYPVITFTDEKSVHKGSRSLLTNDDPSLYEQLSSEKHVTAQTPPIFLAHGADDRTVPVENSILFFQACKAAKVPVELHLFSHGSHGFGLGGNDPELKNWPQLMMLWMGQNKLLSTPTTLYDGR